MAGENISNSAYGKVQVHGYCSSAFVISHTTRTCTAGDILIPVNAQWYLNYSAASDGKSGFVYYAGADTATATTVTTASTKVLIRAL